METPHTIFGFVGPSGSGKTTLILELIKRFPHIQVVKSTSTRPRRDDIDDIFYDLVGEEEFRKKIETNKLINYHQYSNYWYGTNFETTSNLLQNHCGAFALVENSVEDIRSRGFHLTLIKIIPEKEGDLVRSETRAQADKLRAQIQLDYKLIIHNSFAPGGLEKSMQVLTEFIEKEISKHEVHTVA